MLGMFHFHLQKQKANLEQRILALHAYGAHVQKLFSTLQAAVVTIVPHEGGASVPSIAPQGGSPDMGSTSQESANSQVTLSSGVSLDVAVSSVNLVNLNLDGGIQTNKDGSPKPLPSVIEDGLVVKPVESLNFEAYSSGLFSPIDSVTTTASRGESSSSTVTLPASLPHSIPLSLLACPQDDRTGGGSELCTGSLDLSKDANLDWWSASLFKDPGKSQISDLWASSSSSEDRASHDKESVSPGDQNACSTSQQQLVSVT